MAGPNSLELRQRIVDAYENGEGTYDDIAERFMVGVASVSRYLRLHRYGGDLTPAAMGGRRREMPAEHLALLRNLVVDEPNWTTQELADELNEGFDDNVSRRRVGRALRNLGFTFKRGSSDHQQPNGRTSSPADESTSPNKGTWTLASSSS